MNKRQLLQHQAIFERNQIVMIYNNNNSSLMIIIKDCLFKEGEKWKKDLIQLQNLGEVFFLGGMNNKYCNKKDKLNKRKFKMH